MGAEAGGQADDIVVRRIAPCTFTVPCSTATRVCVDIAAHIETRAGDRDLAAAGLDHERSRRCRARR